MPAGPHARRIRSVLVAALASCGSVLAPAGATAATVAAAPPAPEVASELPFTVTITGTAETPSTLSVGFAKVGEGCSGAIVDDQVLDSLPVWGPFSMAQPGLVQEPGPHLLCAYLQDDRNRTVAASVGPFTARPPRSWYVVTAPAVVALGQSFAVRVSGGSEAPRLVFGKLAQPGTGCAQALSSGRVFMGLRYDLTALDQVEHVRLQQYGAWRICVRTQRFAARPDQTDAVSHAVVRVTVRCTSASHALSRARDRWRAMSRRLRLLGLPPSPQLRIRGMAVRSARARVEEACAPGA